MSNITLQIGGRSYAVACADGQEDHVRSLGMAIDARLAAMGTAAGQNEPRTLLFAALLLADELHELRNHPPAGESVEDLVPALEALAERLENLAQSLEHAVPGA